MRSLRLTVCLLFLTFLPVAAMAYQAMGAPPMHPHPIAKCAPQACQPELACPPIA